MIEQEQIIMHLTEAIRLIESTDLQGKPSKKIIIPDEEMPDHEKWIRYKALRDLRWEYSCKVFDLPEVIYANPPWEWQVGDILYASCDITEEMLGNDDEQTDSKAIVVPSGTFGEVIRVAQPSEQPYEEDLRYLVRFAVGGEWWTHPDWLRVSE
jgi:hypothetical protein